MAAKANSGSEISYHLESLVLLFAVESLTLLERYFCDVDSSVRPHPLEHPVDSRAFLLVERLGSQGNFWPAQDLLSLLASFFMAHHVVKIRYCGDVLWASLVFSCEAVDALLAKPTSNCGTPNLTKRTALKLF